MVQKVIGSQELLRSSGTVTKKLAAWLYEQGYASESERARPCYGSRGTRCA